MIMDDLILRMALGGLGVALVAGPLGVFVVWRRMAYFGAALAHSALLGVALGLFFEVHMVFTILAVALAMALVLNALEDSPILSTDTVLGILAHGFLAVGLVATTFMGGDLHLHLDLEATLFGDIMAGSQGDIAVSYTQLTPPMKRIGLCTGGACWLNKRVCNSAFPGCTLGLSF